MLFALRSQVIASHKIFSLMLAAAYWVAAVGKGCMGISCNDRHEGRTLMHTSHRAVLKPVEDYRWPMHRQESKYEMHAREAGPDDNANRLPATCQQKRLLLISMAHDELLHRDTPCSHDAYLPLKCLQAEQTSPCCLSSPAELTAQVGAGCTEGPIRLSRRLPSQ